MIRVYNYESTIDYGADADVSGIFGLIAGAGAVMYFISLAISILIIVAMWKLFKKAGKPGWASIVPIYNIIVMLEIAELPMWYIALFFVPFANIYAMFKIYIELAHKFGKSTGFGVAMVFFSFICIPMLAFGNAEYIGSTSGSAVNNTNMQTNTYGNVSQQSVNNTNINSQVMNTNMVNNNSVSPVSDNTVNNTLNNLEQSMKKTCPNCGVKIDFNASFCTNCGHNMQ